MKISRRIMDLKCFLVWDYSQIEIRMLAEMSKDPLLIKQFKAAGTDAAWAKAHNLDIHCQVGGELTDWPAEKIAHDHDVRRSVKEFHFAIVFGVSKDSLYGNLKAKGVKITRQQSNQFYDRYFRKYRGVARFMTVQRAKVQSEGVVTTLFGFRRPISSKEQEDGRSSYWGNQAVNTPIQGSAHQLVLIALAILDERPKDYPLLDCPLMEVHDALNFRHNTRDLPEAYLQGKYLLQTDVADYAKKNFGITLQVPLVAEAKAGYRLGSLVDYKGGRISEFLTDWRAKHEQVEREGWKALLEKVQV